MHLATTCLLILHFELLVIHLVKLERTNSHNGPKTMLVLMVLLLLSSLSTDKAISHMPILVVDLCTCSTVMTVGVPIRLTGFSLMKLDMFSTLLTNTQSVSALNCMVGGAALLQIPTARTALLPKLAALWTRMIWSTFVTTPRSTWVGVKRLTRNISGLLYGLDLCSVQHKIYS